MSLRLRLALTFASVMAVVVIAFGLVLYVATRSALETEMDRRLRVRSSVVQLTIWPTTTSLTPENLAAGKLDLAPLNSLNAPNLYVQVLDRQGQIIGVSDTLRETSLPIDAASMTNALDGEAALSYVTVNDAFGVRVLSTPIEFNRAVVGVLQVGQSRLPLQETMSGLARVLEILGALALAAAAGVGWIVADRGLRDLVAISHQAARISRTRDFGGRLDIQRATTEVGQLARTIDDLLVTIDDTLRTHREFVSDTSHELRNPLLALQTNLDLLEQVHEPTARSECLAEAQLQVQRMTRLVSDLLMLAQREPRLVLERQPTPLRLLVERVAREAERRARGQRIRLGRLEPLTVIADEDRLAQVLTNLVDNAIKHTASDGTIELSIISSGDYAELIVVDDGDGVDAEHLPHIFDRFYRIPARGGRNDQGTGLGLAIVKHLAEAHGGQVEVTSHLGQGSKFTVRLPLPTLPDRPPLVSPAAPSPA